MYTMPGSRCFRDHHLVQVTNQSYGALGYWVDTSTGFHLAPDPNLFYQTTPTPLAGLMVNNRLVRAEIKNAVKKIRALDRKNQVQFIILYGSLVEGKHDKLSDIDFAVGYNGDRKQRFDFRIRALAELGDKFDVQIYQDLPLYVKEEVLKGKVFYARDMKLLNEVALKTIQDLGFYKPRFLDYVYR